MAGNKEKAPKKRKPLFRWRGLLAESEMRIRLVVFAVLITAAASLSFTQMGFAGLPLGDVGKAYIVVLLIPISLAALLLGPGFGTLAGLFAGVVLFVHALVLPLDYYELVYVTPFSSIVMMTLSGFLFGFLFAIFLRNNPGKIKRVVGIIVSCLVVSWLYSLGFVLNVIVALIQEALQYAEALGDIASMDIVQRSAALSATTMGSADIQAWVDAALVSAVCLLASLATCKAQAVRGHIGLQTLFGTRLLVVVFAAFMGMAAVSFCFVTADLLQKAKSDMKDEVSFVLGNVLEGAKRAESMDGFLDAEKTDVESLSDESFEHLVNAMGMRGELAGYSKDKDGTLLIFKDNVLFESDDDYFTIGQEMQSFAGSGLPLAVAKSLKSGTIERLAFDAVRFGEDGAESEEMPQVSLLDNYLAYTYAQESDGYTVVSMYPSNKVFASRNSTMGWVAVSALVLLLAVFAITYRLLKRVVSYRIDETNKVLARVTGGDLNARLDVAGTTEFASLSQGINDTVSALQGWISEAETRMDTELATAKAIQESALPRIFPPYPSIMRFDIYATMGAAKEVGGDFYDFFLIGDDSESESSKLAFIVADVSGKGVPAALFMMQAKTQLRDYLMSGMEPGEAVENTNRQLCEGNDAGMFVTVWAGVLDYATGHVVCVNAGHNPPLLWRNGSWEWLKERSGMPLGLFDGLPYQSYELDCQIGDQFLLYSDGVTEAMSMEGELYGEERLEKLLQEKYLLHPRPLVEAVRRDVARHARGAEQSDDITILAMEVGVPPEVTATLKVPADVKQLNRVNSFIHTELDRRLCPLRVQNQIDIAVEELFVNVAHYAYQDATEDNPGMVRISYTYAADPPSISIDIADSGIPYNPLEKPDAVTPDNIEDVPIGGLGILMAKQSVNEMRYERVDGNNIVTIVKKW